MELNEAVRSRPTGNIGNLFASEADAAIQEPFSPRQRTVGQCKISPRGKASV
ncbi:hypothetical protein QTJ16_006476 [Diplocarpon rosae]|uniref:Uncharacterized protein n=1 Tax=Diplocarpon rosae TaxID=946125 RepID=A0AAD9WCM6_9HELO|nr:hypothetical protein QTJ16_006476 [Diplocarpon rosae]